MSDTKILTYFVSAAHTASAVGSGTLDVLGTPVLAAWLEAAACALLAERTDAATTSVGTRLELFHDAPTPIGMQVQVAAQLLSLEGRSAQFSLTASDEGGEIAHGTHSRVLVQAKRFLQKANAKRTASGGEAAE